MPAAIETDGLTKDFLVGFWRPRPYRALDALTLQVEPGEVFGFLGPNGAGKSTTLKLLVQLIYPSSGSAQILGRPVGDLEVRRRIGFLAENPYYYDYLTAEEVLAYFARLFGYSGAEVRTRVARVLDDVGMAGQRRLRLRQLSKGLLQRVGLEPEGRKYTPHVTLARLRDSSSRQVADYLTERASFRSAPFRVERFVLYSSRDSVGGGPYLVEQAYPLAA